MARSACAASGSSKPSIAPLPCRAPRTRLRPHDVHAPFRPTFPGIALDNSAALQILGDHHRLLTFRPEARGYKVYKKRGRVVEEEIEQREEFVPLEELLRV